jgi:hypothetical protein
MSFYCNEVVQKYQRIGILIRLAIEADFSIRVIESTPKNILTIDNYPIWYMTDSQFPQQPR